VRCAAPVTVAQRLIKQRLIKQRLIKGFRAA